MKSIPAGAAGAGRLIPPIPPAAFIIDNLAGAPNIGIGCDMDIDEPKLGMGTDGGA